MATLADAVTVNTSDTTITAPTPAPPAAAHARIVVLNVGANVVWIRVDNNTTPAVAASPEHVAVMPSGVVELDPRTSWRAIAVGGTSVLNLWGRP